MKLIKLTAIALLLCSCSSNKTHEIRQVKKVVTPENEKYEFAERDNPGNYIGTTISLSSDIAKINFLSKPTQIFDDSTLNQINKSNNLKEETLHLTNDACAADGVNYFASSVKRKLLFGESHYMYGVREEYQQSVLTSYFERRFCNGAYKIDDDEHHMYVAKINKYDARLIHFERYDSFDDVRSNYDDEFLEEYKSQCETKHNETQIYSFLDKYGIGLIDGVIYASYDIELYSLRWKNMSEYDFDQAMINNNGVPVGGTMDDYWHLTTADENGVLQEKLMSYTFRTFDDHTLFPIGVSENYAATTFLSDTCENYVREKLAQINRWNTNATKLPKQIRCIHNVRNVNSDTTISSDKPYDTFDSFENQYLYDLKKLQELGYKKVYCQPGAYINNITNKTRITFELGMGTRTIKVFDDAQLIKQEGLNTIEIPYYVFDIQDLIDNPLFTIKITPENTTAQVLLVMFEFVFTL